MPTFEEYQAHLYRSDSGLGMLFVLVLLGTASGIVLQRRGMFKLSGALSVSTLVLNPITITVVAILLRMPLLFNSLWYDEAYSAHLVQMPFERLGAAILQDVHPPFHYLLLWIYGHGQPMPEAIYRLPIFLLSLFSIYLIARLCIAMGLSKQSAYIAALLVAISPGMVYYGTELRPYALLCCLVVGALIALYEDRPVWLAGLLFFIPMIHNIGVFYTLAIAAVALLHHRSWRYAPPALFSVLGCLLIAPIILLQTATIVDGHYMWFDWPHTLWILLLNVGVLPETLIFPVVIPTLALTIIVLFASRNFLQGHGAPLALVMIFVPFIVAAVSMLWKPIFVSRSFIPIALLLSIPTAYAVTYSRAGRLIAWVGVPVLVLAIINQQTGYGGRPPYREIFKQCDGARSIHYPAIHTAFIGSSYWQGAATVWAGAQDNGMTFDSSDMPTFGFTLGAALPGDTCLVLIDTPRTTESERDYVSALISSHEYTVTVTNVNREQVVYVYRIQI